MKKIKLFLMTLAFSISMLLTAMAGQWNYDGIGWWYQNSDKGYPAGGWQWIDGKCYYFSSGGYCLMNTTTPDGYTVGTDGAWMVNGMVQTQNNNSQLTAYQKSVITDSLEIYMYTCVQSPYNYPGSPSYVTYLSESKKLELFGNHLIIDSLAAITNRSTMYPLVSCDQQTMACWYDYTKTRKMFRDLYGINLSEQSLKNDFTIVDNKICAYPGDAGEWSVITIDNYSFKDNKLVVIATFKTVDHAADEVVEIGSLTATYTINADSFFGYTLESIQ